MCGGVGILFFGVGECPHPLKSNLFDKFEKLGKVFIGFPRKTNHQGGAEGNAGYFATYRLDQVVGLLLGDVTSHAAELSIGDMLQGYVEIVAHILSACHHIEYIHRKVRRIGVVEPYPFHTLDVSHLVDQRCQSMFFIKVKPITGEVLRYDIELTHPFRHKRSHFVEDLFLRT